MLQAYLDCLSAPPGASVEVHASDAAACLGEVRRLRHSDPHPAGPGVLDEPSAWGAVEFSVPVVPPTRGSYATVDGVFADIRPGAVSAWFMPTDLRASLVIFSWQAAGAAWWLGIAEGLLTLFRDDAAVAHLGLVHREREWYFLGIGFESDGGTQLFSGQWGRTGGPFIAEFAQVDAVPDPSSPLQIGARVRLSPHDPNSPVCGELDGRVAGVAVHAPDADIIELMNEMNGYARVGAARWDLTDLADPDRCPASDGTGRPWQLHSAPARSGVIPPPIDDSQRALVPPGSVHFHRDDLEDPGWPLVATIAIPADADPGCYCLRLRSGADVCELPFVVSGRDRVTLLIPTLTWQAYGNLGRDRQAWPGPSHYSLHTDGSAVHVTSMLRPCQTFAPSARLEVDDADGFATDGVLAHLLMADLYADYWLAGLGPHGLIDDRDLHFDGLDGVEVLVLSAHPEYWTAQMLDAVEAFLERGGNVLCLGGNALYWVSVLHPRKPHLLEVRRWGGSQTASADPADRSHQFARCTGGTWTGVGRPPNLLLGVSFAGFGAGPSMRFERTADSYASEYAWVFDGVDEVSFGDGGINAGTGNEFDRYDEQRATAGTSVVLARSEPDSGDHFGNFEERGERAPAPAVRADMTLTTTPAGGYVFSLSSISASGCLVSSGSGDLARICTNVLAAMLSTTSAARS